MKARSTSLALVALIGLALPAAAQDDPFETIVSNKDGAEANLDDVTVPLRNPTGDELRQYLEAFRLINLNAAFTVDDGTRRRNAGVTIPAGEARLGPFEVPNGTLVSLKAGFTKKPGEKEAVLRSLEMVPSNPMALGPLRFNRMTLDGKGVIHMKLNLNLMGVDFWPQEVTIEKVYRDAQGNTVFKTAGTGLAGAFVPDIRITPSGQVQRWSRGWWLFGWHGGKWKDVEDKGKKVSVAASLPINRWPPQATDLLDWMPKPGATGTRTAADLDAMRPLLEAIPVKDMSLSFVADADPRRITLSNGEGYLDLRNHGMRVDTHGSFRGRTFETDPSKPNGYRATGTISGEVNNPAFGRARIDEVDLNLSGTTRLSLPFEDPSKVELEATVDARARARLSNVEAGLPGGPRVAAAAARASFDGTGKVVLRPFNGDQDAKRDLTISKDSRYALSVDGPVTLSGLDRAGVPGVTLPERMSVRAADDPTTPADESKRPVLEVEGNLGTKMGFVFARTDVRLNGETTTGGAVAAINGAGEGRTELSTNLRPGARVHLDAYAFAGIKERTLEGGGVRVTGDLRLSGDADRTRLSGGGVEADLPGTTRVETRVAGNVRYGTRDGAEAEVRSVAAAANVTLRDGEGRVSAGLPGGPRLTTMVAPGTSLGVETGLLRRSTPTAPALETEGYARGERRAKVRASLVIAGGSVAHRDLGLAFRGRATVDLNVALGFKVDPRALGVPTLPASSAARAPLQDKILMGLDLATSFERGAQFLLAQPGGVRSTLTLKGGARFTAHADAVVDPRTGAPALSALDGVDVTLDIASLDADAVLPALGVNDGALRIGSRTTVRIKGAKVEFGARTIRITHKGIVFEVAPGTIEIGR